VENQKLSYTRIKTDNENVLAFKREKNGKKVYYIANLSAESVNVKIGLNGKFHKLYGWINQWV
jgi:alpha-amylase